MTQKSTVGSSLKSLETLRIIAAVAVVLTHCGHLDIPLLRPFLGGSMFVGAIGVDIFFVISGFVMGCSTMRAGTGVDAAINFVFARALRLFPLYALCTLAAAATLFAAHKTIDPSYLLDSLFLIPAPEAGRFADPLVFLGWTLRFEFYFYALVAGGVAFNQKVAFPIAGILLSFAVWIWSGYYFGAPIVLEFVAGFLLSRKHAWLADRIRAQVGAPVFLLGLLVAVGLVLSASTGHDVDTVDRGIYSAVPRMWIVYHGLGVPRIIAWGIPSFLLVYFCLGLEHDFKWRLAFLGKYTYSVYLIQYFLLLISMKAKKLAGMPDVLIFVVGVFFLAVCSFVSFRYIETPVLNLRYRFSRRSVLAQQRPAKIPVVPAAPAPPGHLPCA